MKLPVAAVRRISSDFAHADLGDPRRTRRVGRVVGKLARRPQVSLPEAMGSEAELEGAYRLMNNQAVTFDLLHEAHAGATVERAQRTGPLLAIHDTTTCHFPHADPAEVGYLNTGKPGFFLHYTLLVPRGSKRPLGTTYAEPIFRSRAPKKRSSTQERRRGASGAQTRKKKNREFERWERGIAHTSALLPTADVLHIADRESDSYELMADCIEHRHRFVFRVRMKNRGARSAEGIDGSVGELVETTRGVLTREVAISRRKSSSAPRSAKAHPSRPARAATLRFASTRVELRRPRYMGSAFPATLSVNVVRVWEPKPPKGHEPIEWLLYTTEPIETPEDVSSVVDAYRARWLIEECNKALKSGCLIEERQFESKEALLTFLALCLPIAVEILALRAHARERPDSPASELLSPLQIKVLRHFSSRKIPAAPTAQQALLGIAALGGHKRSNGEPGWLILQRGMNNLLAYEKGWRAALGMVSDL